MGPSLLKGCCLFFSDVIQTAVGFFAVERCVYRETRDSECDETSQTTEQAWFRSSMICGQKKKNTDNRGLVEYQTAGRKLRAEMD